MTDAAEMLALITYLTAALHRFYPAPLPDVQEINFDKLPRGGDFNGETGTGISKVKHRRYHNLPQMVCLVL
jgi:hypothetical protein